MSDELEKAVRIVIIQRFGEPLAQSLACRARWGGDEINITGKTSENSDADANLLRICFDHSARVIYLPTILIPQAFRHQNIGKNLIAGIFELADAAGYDFQIVQLVPHFYHKLVARGAESIEFEDVVRITRTTNLSQRSPGEFRTRFNITVNGDEPATEAHHWGELPYPVEEMQDSEIELLITDYETSYGGKLSISRSTGEVGLSSAVIVIRDLWAEPGKDVMRIRLPVESLMEIKKLSTTPIQFALSALADIFKPYRLPTQLAAEE